jgi:hypothetical protein
MQGALVALSTTLHYQYGSGWKHHAGTWSRPSSLCCVSRVGRDKHMLVLTRYGMVAQVASTLCSTCVRAMLPTQPGRSAQLARTCG